MTHREPQIIPEEKKDDPQRAYAPPRIITYTSEELLEQVGPAMACSPNPCPAG